MKVELYRKRIQDLLDKLNPILVGRSNAEVFFALPYACGIQGGLAEAPLKILESAILEAFRLGYRRALAVEADAASDKGTDDEF